MLQKKITTCFLIYRLLFACNLLFLAGCATTPPITPPKLAEIPGIYHRVEKGQTLWRVSQIYNIDLDDLARANNILDTSRIEVGQLIFIPERQKPQGLGLSSTSSVEDFIWPVRGKVIAAFGQAYNNMLNKGINIETSMNSDIIAARSGRVIFYDPNFKGFGKTVIIDHNDGLATVYTRNSQVLVKVGDSVTRGVIIAKAGSAGRDKNVYLHFEIRKRHIPQNPYFYLP